MRLHVTITPDEITPESMWHLSQGLDRIGVVSYDDELDAPYELTARASKSYYATLDEAAAAADELAEARARTSFAKPVQVHRETYRDVEFVITRHPATAGDRSRRFARYELLHDGRHVQ